MEEEGVAQLLGLRPQPDGRAFLRTDVPSTADPIEACETCQQLVLVRVGQAARSWG